MNVSIETLIEIIIREVLAELRRRGIDVDGEMAGTTASTIAATQATAAVRAGGSGQTRLAADAAQRPMRAVIDLSMFRTPVLSEHHLASLDDAITEIVIPKKTIITPGAKEIIKHRALVVSSALPK